MIIGHWSCPRAEKSLRMFLREMGGQLSFDDAVLVLADVAEALVAIDGRVVHRDIKPENILLLNGKWCLADFGIARYAEATTAPDTLKFAKSPPYAAPEQWREERAVGATDVYALGVVAYELLAGERPFCGPDYRDQHLGGAIDPIPDIPAWLQSLIVACLSKPTGSRPSPQNLLTRLRSNQRPVSPSSALLQEANAQAVSRRAEEERQESAAQMAVERRHSLFDAGKESLDGILNALNQRIVESAPSVALLREPLTYGWSLNDAALRVDRMVLTQAQLNEGMPFEVVAHTTIRLAIPRDRHGFGGRSHSLWYCDAQKHGVFRWVETAFFGWGQEDVNGFKPFSLPPGNQNARFPLNGVLHTVQVARAFVAIDQGEEEAFFERWLEWFALAAQGLLRGSSSMPETPPQGSWRRGS